MSASLPFHPRSLLRLLAAVLFTLGVPSHAAPPTTREVTLDRAAANKPMDRFFDLSVGADYPGTTGRPENMAQLRMGAPKQLDAAQLTKLQTLTRDLPEVKRTVNVGQDGLFNFTVPLRSNDIALLTLEPHTRP